MTLDELKSLREGEVVVFTKVDERIQEYHNHQVGDYMIFLEIEDANKIGSSSAYGDIVNFCRNGIDETHVISHFSYEICHYIERKIKLERDKKLNSIGI
jgi:hypothetical protein